MKKIIFIALAVLCADVCASESAVDNQTFRSGFDWQATQELLDGVYRRDLRKVRRSLAKKADPNVKNYHGNTLLHIAVKLNDCDIVELLLANGANPNAKNIQQGNITPLHFAKKRDIAKALIIAGAEILEMSSDWHYPYFVNGSKVELLDSAIAEINYEQQRMQEKTFALPFWNFLCFQVLHEGQGTGSVLPTVRRTLNAIPELVIQLAVAQIGEARAIQIDALKIYKKRKLDAIMMLQKVARALISSKITYEKAKQ